MSFKTGLLTYALADFSTRFLALFLYPLYSFYLAKEELGKLDLYVVISQLTISFISLQIGDAIYRWLMDDSHSENHDKIIFVGLITYATTSISFATGYLSLNFFFQWDSWAVLLAYLLCTSFTPILMQTARGLRRKQLFILAALCNSILTFTLCYIFLTYTEMGFKAPLLAGVASHTITSTVLIVNLKAARLLTLENWDWSLTKSMLKYSLPLVSNIASWWVIGPINAVLITAFIGADTNGLYAMAARLSLILVVINSVFSFAWQDLVIGSREKKPNFYEGSFLKYLHFDLSLCLLLTALSRPLLAIATGEQYQDAWRFVPLLVLAGAFSGLCSFLGAGYLKRRLTVQAFTSNLWGSLVNLLVSFVMIHLIGAYGAALGNFIGFFVVFACRFHSNKEYFALKRFPMLEFAQYFCLLALVSWATTILDTMTLQITLASTVFLAFIVANRALLMDLIATKSMASAHPSE